MKRALTPMEVLSKTYKTILWTDQWQAAFGNPEITGIWAVCGNSGNGKSTFLMQAIKELAPLLNRGHMNAYEESIRLTMQKLLKTSGLQEVNGRVTLLKETFPEMYDRMCRPKSPAFYVIDSAQAMRLTSKQFDLLREISERKLIIISLRAEGRQPKGNVAKDIWYDADLKVWIEGYLAVSNGRHNPGGKYVIWPEKAVEYHGLETISAIENQP